MQINAGAIKYKLAPCKNRLSTSRNCGLNAANSGLCVVLLLTFGMNAHAMPRPGMVEFQASRDSFCVVREGRASPIYVDPGDFPGVARAANDLAQDIERVSG